MDFPNRSIRHNHWSRFFRLHNSDSFNMSGRRKIKLSPSYQRVQWKRSDTTRGVKYRQVAISRCTPRSAPSTPSRNVMSPEPQQDYNEDYPPEPLKLPTSLVRISCSPLMPQILSNLLPQSQNDYLRQFMQRRSAHLYGLLKNEAPPLDNQCMSCHSRQCSWRCLDCIGGSSYCIHCFRTFHRLLPFHRVEHWTGTHFAPAWLFQVGVEIHLGHHGSPCPSRHGPEEPFYSTSNPADHTDPPLAPAVDGCSEGHAGDHTSPVADSDDDWEEEVEEELHDKDYGLPKFVGNDVCVIVDKSGVHQLRVLPCCCSGHVPLDMQFLDMGLFPASLRRIKTAFTFGVLDDFRMDNLECKTAGLKYYSKLRRLTSNTFPQSVPVSAGLKT
jgi:hypothetical protein